MISTLQSAEVFPGGSSPLHSLISDNRLLSLVQRQDYQCLMQLQPHQPSEAQSKVASSVLHNSIGVSGGGVVSKSEDAQMVELLDQLELDDTVYNISQPLCIDPQVLKIDFTGFSNHERTLRASVEGAELEVRLRGSRGAVSRSESDRSSRHLSGGGILADCRFLLADCSPVLPSSQDCEVSCPSPITFHYDCIEEPVSDSRISQASTNPFKSFLPDVRSLDQVTSIPCRPSYENVTPPTKKTASQCSTRAVSPEPRIPLTLEIPLPLPSTPSQGSPSTNPFLLNASVYPTDTNPFKLLEKDVPSQLPKSSFFFAVPVLPIFNNGGSQCSTSREPRSADAEMKTEHVYQNNPSPHLQKLMSHQEHSEYDLQCLKNTVQDLKTSGWYYERISWQDSVNLLRDADPGTFLIRDSSDPHFLFSLSVQTSRGPTSVRLHYVNGHFRLDAERKLIPYMPSFTSIVELVDYYVKNTKRRRAARKSKKSKEQVWIDSQGNIYSSILLVKPLVRQDTFPQLQHLARLAVNRCLHNHASAREKLSFKVVPVFDPSPFSDRVFCDPVSDFSDEFKSLLALEKLPVPPFLVQYLRNYPYCH